MFGSRCLVVDDSPTIRLTLKAMLERAGIAPSRIHLAPCGADALLLFQEHAPDIVFLDVEMPDREGHEVCRDLLALAPLAKIIAVTGLERSDPRVRNLITQGAFDVVEKPLRIEKVQDILDQVKRETLGIDRIR